MPTSEPCPERVALSQKLSAATATLFKARDDYNSGKARKAANLDELHLAIAKARSAERDAVKAYEDHSKAHGCKV